MPPPRIPPPQGVTTASSLDPAVQREIDADIAAHFERPHGSAGFVATVSGGLLVPVREGLVAGYVVRPHVQRYNDRLLVATRVKTIGTYPGHSPAIDLALDQFHRIGDLELADALCDFFLANWEEFGGRYHISRRWLWHRLDPVWRWMEDRGDPTQNHEDHGHSSFEQTAPDPKPKPIPQPIPEPEPKEYTAMHLHLVYDSPTGKEDWLWLGPERIWTRIAEGGVYAILKGEKVQRYEVDGGTFRSFASWAKNARFTG